MHTQERVLHNCMFLSDLPLFRCESVLPNIVLMFQF